MTTKDKYIPGQSDLFAGDTLASPSVLPGSKEARKTTAIYGRSILGSYKKLIPNGLFAKMFLDISIWASTLCYLTWKPRITPGNRLLFQLAPLTATIDEIESGLLPTITAQEYGTNKSKSSGAKTRPSLQTMARQLWATPNTMDHLPQRSEESLIKQATTTRKGRTRPANLREQVDPETVKLWPTPTANEDAAGRPGSKMQKMLGNNPDIRQDVEGNLKPGTLNPDWVESLMGFPIGWTDLNIDNVRDVDYKEITPELPEWLTGFDLLGNPDNSQCPRTTEKSKGKAARIKILGNAVVPQIPEIIGRAIMEIENQQTTGAQK